MSARQMFDVDAERAALGGMLLSAAVVPEVEERLSAEAFFQPAHATIFRAIVALHAAGRPTDPVSVIGALAASGELTRVGGAPYLHEVIAATPSPAMAPSYARTVAEHALVREVDRRIGRIQQLIQQGGGVTAAELLDRAQQMLAGVDTNTAAVDDGSQAWGELMPDLIDAIEQASSAGSGPVGVPTGFLDLDRLLNGLHPGQLVVIAARPGIGKTILLSGIAQHAAWRHKLPVGLFSLEMTKRELGMRLISAWSRIPLRAIQEGRLSDEEWTKVTRLAADTADVPLRIDDTPYMTLADIRNRARRWHRRMGGLSLLGVDYLQLLIPEKAENRQVAVSGISRGLKLLGKELGIPVVVVAQLNRGPENRVDKRPQLSDLRESGSIEQDADVVILVHRDDYYDPESVRAGEADLIVAKNRGGPTDTVTVASQLHLSRFVDMAVV